APPVQWENAAEPIPTVTYPEILNILRSTKKKQSLDNYGLSPFILDKIPQNYWHLLDRGISPDNQSEFRAGFRLQTRVLLLIEQISSYMLNSSPTATVFVDF
ncbi:unnamed protein product, partial [Rotaria magnacalcarata]